MHKILYAFAMRMQCECIANALRLQSECNAPHKIMHKNFYAQSYAMQCLINKIKVK